MKAFLIAALLLAVCPSSLLGSERKLQKWLSTGSWSKGIEYCNGELVDGLSRRPDLRSVSAGYLARLAVYCAAFASGKGDELSSGWWWYTAASLDLEAAQSLLPELENRPGAFQAFPALRNRVPWGAHEAKVGEEVRLLSGEIVPGSPPRPVHTPNIPDYMGRQIFALPGAAVVVEIVVSRDGVPRQPLLVNAQALPVQVLFAYQYLRDWRFEPAQVNG